MTRNAFECTVVDINIFNRGHVFAMSLFFFLMLLCTPLCATPTLSCKECTDTENSILVDCLGDNSGTCLSPDQASPTPHCSREFLGVDSNISLLLSLGGHSYQDVFGPTVPDFQCSILCDGTQTIDTTICTRARACNTVSCMTEVVSSNQEPRACPVYITKGLEEEEKWKVDVKCQSCSECGETQIGVTNESGWGLGCARECTNLLCDDGEVYDWTDNHCKPCVELFNYSLCFQHIEPIEAQVTGHLPRVQFKECQARGHVDVQYGTCTVCPSHECMSGMHPDATCGCSKCKRDTAMNREYTDATNQNTTMYCQIKACEEGRTGVFGDGTICVSPCRRLVCPDGHRQAACMLPHDTRCIPIYPPNNDNRDADAINASMKWEVDVVNASANRLETMTAPWHNWASFENILVTMSAREKYQEQCVWNTRGILDNAFEPGGVAAVFWPRDISSAAEYRESGTQKCRPRATGWAAYPLLPLQNTVSFDGDTTRRVLVNSTLRAVSYAFASSGWDFNTHTRPAFSPDVGELLVVLDISPQETVHMHFRIPTDRATVNWARWWRLSLFVNEVSYMPHTPLPITTGVELSWKLAQFPPGGVGIRGSLDIRTWPSELTTALNAPPTQAHFHFASTVGSMLYVYSDHPFIASDLFVDMSDCNASACAALALGSDPDAATSQVIFNQTILTQSLAVTSTAGTRNGHKCLAYVGTLSGVYCATPDLDHVTGNLSTAMLHVGGVLLVYGPVGPSDGRINTLRAWDEEHQACTVSTFSSDVVAMARDKHSDLAVHWVVKASAKESTAPFLALHRIDDGLMVSRMKVQVNIITTIVPDKDTQPKLVTIIKESNICNIDGHVKCNMAVSRDVVFVACVENGMATVYVCRDHDAVVASNAVALPGNGMLSIVVIGPHVVLGRNGFVAIFAFDGVAIKTDYTTPQLDNTFRGAHFMSSSGGFVLFRDLIQPISGECTGWLQTDLSSLFGIVVEDMCTTPEPVSQSVLVVSWVSGVFVTARMGGVFTRSAVSIDDNWLYSTQAIRIRHHGNIKYASSLSLRPVAAGGHGSVYMMPSAVVVGNSSELRPFNTAWNISLGEDSGLFVFVHDNTFEITCRDVVLARCDKGSTALAWLPLTGILVVMCFPREFANPPTPIRSAPTCRTIQTNGEADLAMYAAEGVEQTPTFMQDAVTVASAMAAVSTPGTMCRHGAESWWTCRLVMDGLSSFTLAFARVDDYDTTRYVGVDDVQVLPMLSDYTTEYTETTSWTYKTEHIGNTSWTNKTEHKEPTSWTDVYIPTSRQLDEAGVAGALRQPRYESGWKRLHVLVGVFCGPGTCEPDVRLWLWDASGELATEQYNIQATGCSASGHALSATTSYAACGLEIPVDIPTPNSDADLSWRLSVTGCAVVTRIDVSIPPHMSLLECAWDEYFAIDNQTCVACGGQCTPGHFSATCSALVGTSSCQPCPQLSDHQEFKTDCTWQCMDGYWRYYDTCQECGELICGMGQYSIPCTPYSDTDCGFCSDQIHAHYVDPGTCDQVCDTGYFRSERGVCERCSTMSMLHVGIELIDRATGDFFRTHNCTAVSDAFYERCAGPDNGTYVGDGTQWSMDCVLKCDPAYYLVMESKQMYSKNAMIAPLNKVEERLNTTVEWRSSACVHCTVPRGHDDNPLPEGSFAMDNLCTVSCLTPFHARGGKCVQCLEERCAIGKYLTGPLCDNCEDCLSTQTDVNFRFTSKGALDANTSCHEQCIDGMYNQFGLGTCKNYSTPVCHAQQFLQGGSITQDYQCRDCASCEGRKLVRACGSTEDTVCEACGELGSGESWNGTACDRVCKPGYVRDHRTRACELCTFACPPGYETALNRQNCTHCQTCPRPNITNWEWVQRCEWACRIGFERQGKVCRPRTSNEAGSNPSLLHVRCPAGTKPQGIFGCAACHSTTVTPPESQINLTWLWLATGEPCQWTCVMPLVKHVVSVGVACIPWTTYRRATTVDASIVRVVGLPHPSTLLNTLNRWEVFVALGCLLLLIILIIAVKVP